MDKIYNFAIVKFPQENDARGIVPILWIIQEEGLCYYPTVTTNEMRDSLIKTEACPEEDWPKHEMIVLKKFVTYSDARLMLREAEMTSNLESEDEEVRSKRKRQPNKKLKYPNEKSDYDDSESEYPPTKSNNKKEMQSRKYPNFEKENKPFILNLDSAGSCVASYSDSETPPTKLNKKKEITPKQCLNFEKEKNSNVLNIESVGSLEELSPSFSSVPSRVGFGLLTPKSNNDTSKKLMPMDSTLKTQVTQLQQGQKRLEAFMVDLIGKVSEINQTLQEILPKLVDPSVGQQSQDHEEPLLSLLPIENVENFRAIEKKLLEMPAFRNKLVRVFQTVGGGEINTLCINIMRRAMTDELAQNFSFTGKKGYKEDRKEPFASTELFKTIQAAVRRNFKESFSEEKTKKHLTMWLNQSKTRLNRREERKSKSLSEAVGNLDENLLSA